MQMVALPRDNASFGAPRYTVQSEGSGRSFARHPDYVWIYCNTGGNGHPMLIVDLQAKQFKLVDNAGIQSPAQPINPMQVCEFLRLRSPDDADAQLMNASERIVSSVRDQIAGNIPSEELRTSNMWNGASLSYSVAGGVKVAMILLSWALLSLSLIATTLALKRRSLRKRRQLWREEVERLGLARTI
jgi:hypothetical protein